MISIIMMMIVFMAFAAIVSYSIMTMNNSILVSTDVSQQQIEMKMIKNLLITKAKPIVEKGVYSLPVGNVEGNYHTLPDGFGLPIKTKDGRDYLYCPYGQIASSASDVSIEQTSSSYNADIMSLNGVDYVTHTSQVDFPDVKAFIVSPDTDHGIDCSSIEYDANQRVYYSLNGKVEWILNQEIDNYFLTNNLSNETEHLIVDNTNQNQVFNLVANDLSNKNYSLTLLDDLDIASTTIERHKSKTANVHIDLGSNSIIGATTLRFENVNVVVDGSNATQSIAANSASISVKDGALSISNAQVPKIRAVNSEISFDGDVKVNSSSSSTNTSIISLINSDLVVLGSLSLNNRDNGHTAFITLTNSDIATYGNVLLIGHSSKEAIKVSPNSSFYQNSGTLTFSGESDTGIALKGSFFADGISPKIVVAKTGMVDLFVIDGGSLNLNDASLLETGSMVSGYAIKELGKAQYLNGSAIIKNGDRCWNGETFKDIDNTDNGNNSSSDKSNNNSNWNCIK